MFTATISNKEQLQDGTLRVSVEFTDGAKTFTEWCIPQDFDGLKFWVKSRLDTLNSAQEIDATYSIGTPIDPNETVAPPAPTQEELDRADWLSHYWQWVNLKKNLIDTGILTGNEAQVVALKNKVQTDFRAAYIPYL